MTNKIIAHCWKCYKEFELLTAKLDGVFCPYCNMKHSKITLTNCYEFYVRGLPSGIFFPLEQET